jgi:DNA ligase 1
MKIREILTEIASIGSTNAKRDILLSHKENVLLRRALRYGMDPFMPFNVVKVPRVKDRSQKPFGESLAWETFFNAADMCSSREVTGNAAIDLLYTCFSMSKSEDEKWMRKILKKHMAVGASVKSVNKVFPGLIPTFEVSLAQKFEEKRLKGQEEVGVEPKLDGIRCFAIVTGNDALLYARSGKLITNFDSTIGKELSQLPDGCYDGEIMGEDFVSLMRQAYRKENVETEGTYLALFDYLPSEEWESRTGKLSCRKRYESLSGFLMGGEKYLQIVPRWTTTTDYAEIKKLHDGFVEEGYEGAMVKNLGAPYKFGRGYEIMKLKAFHDVDLKIERLLEGTGRHSGKLGSVQVVFNGVDVQVGSGFSDDLREAIWNKPTDFIGRMIEVRYQEVTPDGSLRFPTFVCFRNDR